MKLFTLAQANEMLPVIVPKLMAICDLYSCVETYRPQARAAAGASDFGGGMKGGAAYVNALYNIGRLTTEIHAVGVELKDHKRGLIDFPSMRGDRIVVLCWQFGEGDQVSWWHEVEDGFAGRQPI
ncbi:MAG: DUF2203 domain-containing protein [Pyrinomonadaceae bacterium]